MPPEPAGVNELPQGRQLPPERQAPSEVPSEGVAQLPRLQREEFNGPVLDHGPQYAHGHEEVPSRASPVPGVSPPQGASPTASSAASVSGHPTTGSSAHPAPAAHPASAVPHGPSVAPPGKLIFQAGTGKPPRLQVFDCANGIEHMHHLRPANRLEKLTKMLKDLFKRHEDEQGSQGSAGASEAGGASTASSSARGAGASGSKTSKSKLAAPDQGPLKPTNSILADKQCSDAVSQATSPNQPPSLLSTLAKQMRTENRSPDAVLSSLLKQSSSINDSRLHSKYGQLSSVVGKGSFGVVRLAQKTDPNDKRRKLVYAVKEFHISESESEKAFMKRLASEFCLASSLHHVNIIETLDLLRAGSDKFCGVMEYCAGGDLYSLIAVSGKLETVEADCFFKQVMRGVAYMHEMGVAHRDLKPENVLLTSRGCVKLTDFGNAECFRMAWEKEVHLSQHLAGSGPYIAPEEYVKDEFDPRAVDVWASGVIYLAMCTGRHLWLRAEPDDEFYARYLAGRKDKNGYEPIERLKTSRRRNVIYSMLDPVASRRLKAKQVLNSEWGREIVVCEAGNPQPHE